MLGIALSLCVAIVISERSVERFIIRIWLGRSGKKFRNSEAPAILNIFPKLAPVVMNTYLSVLSKVICLGGAETGL